jgi:hypothetical protein
VKGQRGEGMDGFVAYAFLTPRSRLAALKSNFRSPAVQWPNQTAMMLTSLSVKATAVMLPSLAIANDEQRMKND